METLFDGEFISIRKSDIKGCLEASRKKDFSTKEHFRMALDELVHQVSATRSDKIIGVADLLRIVPDLHCIPAEAIPRLSVEGLKTFAVVIGKEKNVQEYQDLFDRILSWNTKISNINIKFFHTIEDARKWIKSL
jgi:hypothetical protein